MKNTRILWVLIAFVMFRCSDPATEVDQTVSDQQTPLMTRAQMDEHIINSLKTTNEFNWSDVGDDFIWSALVQSDSILTVGYKPMYEEDINSRISTIDVSERMWVEARESILGEANTAGQRTAAKGFDYRVHEVLPIIEIKVGDLEVVRKLRSLETVRYAEPLGYEVNFTTAQTGRTESDSGCSNAPESNLPTSDYYTIPPNAKVSWNYSHMNIEDAWSLSTGEGIGVGLIDTGISPNQAKLNGEFDAQSTGRYINKYGTYVSSWWPWADPDGPNDECGHGTAMAGTIAAPRSNSGTSVGVAYNANLIAYRGTGDVVVNGGSEKTGVADALVALGNRSDVHVISMSIGDVFSNSKVADGVRYAYGKGKLIFSAAGTSTSFTNWYGVIFPATMNETVAVTGIKEGASYQKCDVCHSGDKVDFTIVMEKAGSNNHALTLAMSGNQPSTVGGSSVATATAAGIAALVWARYPNYTRSQILEKLKQSADLYPSRSSEYGWGTIDALAAVN